MKRKVEHPAPAEHELNGPRYWRSLDELAKTPGFQEQLAREFPEGASSIDGVDRRHFMKIMAASFALGGVGLAGCRRPERFILPYGKSVEGVIPGLPVYFATAMPQRKSAIPLLAETHQGRPTKLEGNPSFQAYGGATTLQAQASILDLYDPDRATAHKRGGEILTAQAVSDLLVTINRTHSANGGAGLAFLAESSGSPTRARLVAALRQRMPQATWAEYDAVSGDVSPATMRALFNQDVKPVYRFRQARCILSIDADFVSTEAGSLGYARDFASGRRVTKKEDPMNRLYMAESGFSLTGGLADHRLRLASSQMVLLAGALAGRVQAPGVPAAVAEGLDVKPEWIAECAQDLLNNRGNSLVIAGAHLPAEVHALVYRINEALGNVGRTVEFVTLPASNAATISQLATAIRANSVRTLVILGGNPAYNAPADLDWPALQKSVAEVVRLSSHADETSLIGGTHLAAAHFLESWGDARTADGTIVPIQPMILPLFGGITELEVLAQIAGEQNPDPYALVSTTIAGLARAADPARTMRRFLHDGFLAGSEYPRATVQFNAAALQQLGAAARPQALSKDRLEVRFLADHKMDDGRFANNGWLQECPDPITRIAWDNVILISPRLSKDLGIEAKASSLQVARKHSADFEIGKESSPIVEITVDGRKIQGPAHVQPGLSNYTIVVPLGYGRTTTGRIGTGAGFNAYPLRTSAAPEFVTGATIRVTGERKLLANTQEHWSMEGRDIVREANYEGANSYKENPAFVNSFGMESHTPNVYGEEGQKMSIAAKAIETPRGQSLYENPDLNGVHAWGMSIDLNTCIGCQACVVACQAENNIPIVGREQVMRGREMHWLRIDRYFSDGNASGEAFGGAGNREIPEDPQVSLQPMTCQQCELAPCETVCPVNATVHDDEGLNTMAYNRCIGTRYCANNCPYKVRRFNYFDWNQRQIDTYYWSQLAAKGMPEVVKMVKNPEVSIRMRGVMEKCTYCVQRIEAGKIQHKVKMAKEGTPEKVEVPDGGIRTACQQVCPVEAIIFGNMRDPESAVSKAKAREQDYAVLGYLNTRPRTTYLGRIRNPNPKMPDYRDLPLSRVEYSTKNHPAHNEGGAGEAAH